MVDDFFPSTQRVFHSVVQCLTLWPKLNLCLRARNELLKEGKVFIGLTAFPQPALWKGTVHVEKQFCQVC